MIEFPPEIEKPVTVWKAVRVRGDGRRVSVYTFRHPDWRWILEYSHFERTKPKVKGSLIFAYADPQSAMAEVSNSFDTELWLAEGYGVRPMEKQGDTLWQAQWGDFWAGNRDKAVSSQHGTVGCESLRLIRRVHHLERIGFFTRHKLEIKGEQ